MNKSKPEQVDELKACPICTNDAKILNPQYGTYFAECRVCGTSGPIAQTREEAKRKWNLRLPELPDEWISVEERLPEEYKVVLTQHVDDLFPIPAYYIDNAFGADMIWLREIEGPEDIVRTGKHEQLYGSPTHWQSLPKPPAKPEDV